MSLEGRNYTGAYSIPADPILVSPQLSNDGTKIGLVTTMGIMPKVDRSVDLGKNDQNFQGAYINKIYIPADSSVITGAATNSLNNGSLFLSAGTSGGGEITSKKYGKCLEIVGCINTDGARTVQLYDKLLTSKGEIQVELVCPNLSTYPSTSLSIKAATGKEIILNCNSGQMFTQNTSWFALGETGYTSVCYMNSAVNRFNGEIRTVSGGSLTVGESNGTKHTSIRSARVNIGQAGAGGGSATYTYGVTYSNPAKLVFQVTGTYSDGGAYGAISFTVASITGTSCVIKAYAQTDGHYGVDIIAHVVIFEQA